ncbi:MAG TPA: GTPase [Gemmata sp.]|nr:GTPase [Gemmata sp.]
MTDAGYNAAATPGAEPQPLLRTLAPLLRNLERQVRAWLDTRRKFPLTLLQRAELEGLATDLGRQAEALDVDKPLLTIMLMGGTGVGKSTLFNALAGAPVAQASFTRPTTRDPVVYFHHSVRPDRLDPALRLCRLAQHDRAGLEQKVIVDTPDLDSNDLANREKLKALLPIADVVLYVGSQEKYHDRLGWDLFKEQRTRRAFAFVLNKWDRCVTGESGLRPDEDLLKDLKAEGFASPLLFRTTAQKWLDAAAKSATFPPPAPPDLPEGEQFATLRNWLELGLTRLEIEAVKARGVGQLLATLARVVDGVRPPDLTAEGEKVRDAWRHTLGQEAEVQADVLVGTLDPYQTEVEHHFSVEDQQRYRGLMAAYLRLSTRMRYARSGLRDRIPFAGRLLPGSRVETPVEWNLGTFVQECARNAGERVLDQRTGALVNRLLVEGDQKGVPARLAGRADRGGRPPRLARPRHARRDRLARGRRARGRPPDRLAARTPRHARVPRQRAARGVAHRHRGAAPVQLHRRGADAGPVRDAADRADPARGGDRLPPADPHAAADPVAGDPRAVPGAAGRADDRGAGAGVPRGPDGPRGRDPRRAEAGRFPPGRHEGSGRLAGRAAAGRAGDRTVRNLEIDDCRFVIDD